MIRRYEGGARGLTTRNEKLLVAKGIATKGHLLLPLLDVLGAHSLVYSNRPLERPLELLDEHRY